MQTGLTEQADKVDRPEHTNSQTDEHTEQTDREIDIQSELHSV